MNNIMFHSVLLKNFSMESGPLTVLRGSLQGRISGADVIGLFGPTSAIYAVLCKADLFYCFM